MTTERNRCNKCKELSYNGEFRGTRWFCSDCLREHRISDADTYGTKRTEEEAKKSATEKQILKLIRNAKPIGYYTKKINKQGINNLDLDILPNAYNTTDWGMIKTNYQKLLNNKVLGEDVKLMDDIIKFREKILKHRISCDVKLISQGVEVGELKIYHILLEHANHIVDFWTNKNIDPSGVNNLVYNFQRELQLSGKGGEVRVSKMPSRYTHIDKVKLNFKFS